MGASGEIKNGSYTLTTGGNADGAQAGKFKVTVASKEDYVAKATAEFKKQPRSGGEGSKLPPQFVGKADAVAKSLIPAGYGDPRTTTLSAEVKEQSNTLDFKLSDTDAPPAPPEPAKGKGRKGS